MIRPYCTALVLLTGLMVAPALADDPFMAIHMENQKSGSAVAEYWKGLSAEPEPPIDGFMSIHMANQKIGSAVANFWLLQSQLDCGAIRAAGQSQ